MVRKLGPPIEVFSEKCVGCLVCELRCSLRFQKSFLLGGAAIQVRRASDWAHDITFDERCDNCGICARYCSYGALVQGREGGE